MSAPTLEDLHEKQQRFREEHEELRKEFDHLKRVVLSEHEARLTTVEEHVVQIRHDTAGILQSLGNCVTNIGRLANLVTKMDGGMVVLQRGMDRLLAAKESKDGDSKRS